MELKRTKGKTDRQRDKGFNRTFMELKLIIRYLLYYTRNSFNRTFMELKH